MMEMPKVRVKMKAYARNVGRGMKMTLKNSKTLGLAVTTAGGGFTSHVLV